jgi:hypothetical protein
MMSVMAYSCTSSCTIGSGYSLHCCQYVHTLLRYPSPLLIHVQMNMYMDLADIRVDSPPTKSYILHNFQPVTHGNQYTDPRALDVTSDDWPPDILFDAVYASALCKSWGSESFRTYMTSAWNDDFYGGLSEVQGGRAQISQTQQRNNNEGDKCYAWRDRLEEFLVRRDSRNDRRRDREMARLSRILFNTQNTERGRDKAVQSKVHEWLERSR